MLLCKFRLNDAITKLPREHSHSPYHSYYPLMECESSLRGRSISSEWLLNESNAHVMIKNPQGAVARKWTLFATKTLPYLFLYNPSNGLPLLHDCAYFYVLTRFVSPVIISSITAKMNNIVPLYIGKALSSEVLAARPWLRSLDNWHGVNLSFYQSNQPNEKKTGYKNLI